MAIEYERLIGSRVNTLATWQAMCKKVGLADKFTSIRQCKKVGGSYPLIGWRSQSYLSSVCTGPGPHVCEHHRLAGVLGD